MTDLQTPPVEASELPPSASGEEGVGDAEESGFFSTGYDPDVAPAVPDQQAPAPPAQKDDPEVPLAQAPVPEVPAQPPVDPAQQPTLAKEDDSRFEYWQRKATERELELNTLRGGQTMAIAEYIQRNPDMLDVVEDGMRNGSVASRSQIPERPIRPQMPDDFKLSESLDPETVSGRYQMQFNEYAGKKDLFQEAREQRDIIDTQRNSERAELAALKTGLVQQGGLTVVQAEEFMGYLNSGAARDPVALAKYYKVLNAPSQADVENAEKAQLLLDKQSGLKSPPPLATVPGEAPPQTTDEENYHASMRSMAQIRDFG